MDYRQLIGMIRELSQIQDPEFIRSTTHLQDAIYRTQKDEILLISKEIGTIPEYIAHDSSEEKLYSKATDIVLSRCFQLLGFQSSVNQERANCADVVGRSQFHDYSFVADAKAFRLSRTAKNQKDFKVKSMTSWKGDNDFAILVCPYFHYPRNNSQIYGQALDDNVCLLGWEHISFLLENTIVESRDMSLGYIWNISNELSLEVLHSNRNNNDNYLSRGNELICNHYRLATNSIIEFINLQKPSNTQRGREEIRYWETIREGISQYTREQAITELISAMKINEKISQIQRFIDSL